ncbi:tumor necrosis factor alpha-induced protein 2-like [Rhinoderma darwinii]|uniref:tumor necrosis factor alpha-induced protein 2-like n=1 Tax=Rhinoderma darwinii TaxID=43563 RepID=UPI003F66E39A
MKGSEEVPTDQDKISGDNEKNTPDNKNEQNGNENKKEKKKFKIKNKIKKHFAKLITPLFKVNLEMKLLHKKEKSNKSEMPPLLPGINVADEDIIDKYDEQIEEETLLDETKQLNVMEKEMNTGGSIDNEIRNEMESLHGESERRVFRVIKDSISNKKGNELMNAVQAIVEQEHEDRRPSRQWNTKWKECVASSVVERVNKLPKFSRDAPGSCLSQVLTTLGKALKKDLTHVIKNIKPYYPEEFDVCNIYAQQYHQLLQNEISLVTEYELYITDIHSLLSWIKTTYPNILRDPALIGHINTAELGELLPPEKIHGLERMYMLYQEGLLEQWMTNALEVEEKHWMEGRQPVKIGSICNSELSVDILEIYDSGIKSAKEISDDFVDKVTPILANEFLKFLKRYKTSFTNYHKKNKSKSHFREIIFANMNCCHNFRVFIEGASAAEDIKQNIYSILSEIENQGFRIILQDLFQEIQSHFRRISECKGLNSKEIMLNIITTANTYISSITALDAACHEVMVDKIHMHLVKEYLTQIQHISPCNIEQQKALATQMHNTVDFVTQFCSDHLNDAQVSEATWVNNVIRNIADIIQLQDLEAITLEVGVLVHEYPDIRRRHVKAFLHIKKNLTISKTMSVLKVFKIIKHGDHPHRQLFTFIPCRSFCCLLF